MFSIVEFSFVEIFEAMLFVLLSCGFGAYLSTSAVRVAGYKKEKVVALKPNKIGDIIGGVFVNLDERNFQWDKIFNKYGVALWVIFFSLYFLMSSTVLTTILYGELLAFSLWAGAVIHLLRGKHIKGVSWYVFLALFFLLNALYFVSINFATHPAYSPVQVQTLYEIVISGGLIGLVKSLENLDVFWYAIHFLGVACLFFVFKKSCITLVQLMVSREVYSIDHFPFPWSLGKNNKYVGPLRNMILLKCMTVIAGVMASGLALYFITQELPDMIKIIFNGKGIH